MTDNEYKYLAFLNYSHQDNLEKRPETQAVGGRCWGDWLLEAMQTFTIPAEFVGQINGRGEIIPERIDRIFRDVQEQPEAVTLNAESRKALEQSICLIVICSPRSAESLQVNEAVRYFKQLGRGKHIFPIVVAGEPNASNGNQTGASAEAECFVPALRHPVRPDGTIDAARRAGKHIFVDARHGVEKREVLAKDQRNAEADLEMAKIQLIALVLGVGFNGLWWREQKRHFFDFAEAQHQAREALNQVEEVRRQLQEARHQTREAQNRALEMQNLPRDVRGQIQEAQNQAREAQQQLQEFQNKVRDTQKQLEEACNRALAAEGKVREAQNQLEAARKQASEAQNQQSQLEETRKQVQKTLDQGRNARRLTKVFALLAVLAMLAAGMAASMALRQRKVASQALVKAAAEATGKFDLAQGQGGVEQVRQMLQNIGGAEQDGNRRHSLDQLAASIPQEEIPEALKASSVILNDQQRSHFQKWLLIRLGWVNPESAMACASAIDGKIVNDEELSDSGIYFQLAVLDNWMKTDLPGAFNWVKSQLDSESKNKALETCICELAKTDVPGALTLAESLPEGAWRSTVIVRLWIKADPFAAWEWISGLDLLQEIMPPRKAPLPWTKFLLNSNFGNPTIFPVETDNP